MKRQIWLRQPVIPRFILTLLLQLSPYSSSWIHVLSQKTVSSIFLSPLIIASSWKLCSTESRFSVPWTDTFNWPKLAGTSGSSIMTVISCVLQVFPAGLLLWCRFPTDKCNVWRWEFEVWKEKYKLNRRHRQRHFLRSILCLYHPSATAENDLDNRETLSRKFSQRRCLCLWQADKYFYRLCWWRWWWGKARQGTSRFTSGHSKNRRTSISCVSLVSWRCASSLVVT